jgi:putative phosphonate metabolism protein
MSDAIEGYKRYAIYYAPPEGSALGRLGAAWLGYDAATGLDVGFPHDAPNLPAPRETLVRETARYGFHATLKAPFTLVEGISAADLDEALRAVVATQPPIVAPMLRVAGDLGFACLRPSRPSPELDALAAACVTGLDLLRAPLTPAELAHRRRAGLDTTEDANLRNWGYPYVLSLFRFHMSLTGRLPRLEVNEAAAALGRLFAPVLEPQFGIDDICLFGDPGEGGRFRLLRRYRLAGG